MEIIYLHKLVTKKINESSLVSRGRSFYAMPDTLFFSKISTKLKFLFALNHGLNLSFIESEQNTVFARSSSTLNELTLSLCPFGSKENTKLITYGNVCEQLSHLLFDQGINIVSEAREFFEINCSSAFLKTYPTIFKNSDLCYHLFESLVIKSFSTPWTSPFKTSLCSTYFSFPELQFLSLLSFNNDEVLFPLGRINSLLDTPIPETNISQKSLNYIEEFLKIQEKSFAFYKFRVYKKLDPEVIDLIQNFSFD